MPVSRWFVIAACIVLADAANAATIGVVAPQGGAYGVLGRQIRQGAGLVAAQAGLDVIEIDESCAEGDGAAVADGLAAAKVSIAIGFLCTETLTNALPALSKAGIPVMTLSSRASILMEDALKRGWPLYRLAPAEAAEADLAAALILRDWKGFSVGLIDDGTIYSRELAERVRRKIETAGLKPTFTDTLRPGQEQQVALVRRLGRIGVTHVFVAGERNDVAVIARDAAAESVPLTVLSGDALRATNRPVALTPGVLAVALPNYAALPSAATAAAALRSADIEPEGYALPAFAAAEIAAKAIELAQTQGKPAALVLDSTVFATALGPIAFTAGHELAQNPYRLQRWDGSAFIPTDKAER